MWSEIYFHYFPHRPFLYRKTAFQPELLHDKQRDGEQMYVVYPFGQDDCEKLLRIEVTNHKCIIILFFSVHFIFIWQISCSIYYTLIEGNICSADTCVISFVSVLALLLLPITAGFRHLILLSVKIIFSVNSSMWCRIFSDKVFF